jgi:hypothetical protein
MGLRFGCAIALTMALASPAYAQSAGRAQNSVTHGATASAPHSAATGDSLQVNLEAHPPLYNLPPLHIAKVLPAEVARFRASLTRPGRGVPGERIVPEENEDAYRNARRMVRARKVEQAIASALSSISDPRQRELAESVYGSVYLPHSMMTIAMRHMARQSVDRLGTWRRGKVGEDDDAGYLQKALDW